MNDLTTLHNNVLAWACARQIIPNAKPHTQLMKTGSELGELFDAEIKGDQAGIIDGIGDVLVTLIIYAELREIHFATRDIDAGPLDWMTSHDQLIEAGITYGHLLHSHLNDNRKAISAFLNGLVCSLASYADRRGVTLETCLAAAYREIKDRRGFLTPDGLFVKEVA